MWVVEFQSLSGMRKGAWLRSAVGGVNDFPTKEDALQAVLVDQQSSPNWRVMGEMPYRVRQMGA
jgi:hypothetical protein